eukprot:GCRY01004050.1.p1 GENE.GCRY01004050.1~~GCRY01004050.1.p1  ORF type:complete len:262 (+),score=54.61 GCRY01004050.1:240-1025(+)
MMDFSESQSLTETTQALYSLVKTFHKIEENNKKRKLFLETATEDSIDEGIKLFSDGETLLHKAAEAAEDCESKLTTYSSHKKTTKTRTKDLKLKGPIGATVPLPDDWVCPIPIVKITPDAEPLCGAYPAPAHSILKPESLVAVYDDDIWCLAIVEHYKAGTYHCIDADDHRKKIVVSSGKIKALPTTLPSVWLDKFVYPVGSRVAAVYPDTTSFYEAIVVNTPQETNLPAYALYFDDDVDTVTNETPIRMIPACNIVQLST